MNENARTTGIARAWRSSLSIVLLPPLEMLLTESSPKDPVDQPYTSAPGY